MTAINTLITLLASVFRKDKFYECKHCKTLTIFKGTELWQECALCGSYDLKEIGTELPF